jgi:hypothetical protein
MVTRTLIAIAATVALAGAASAKCNEDLDALAKAVSGPVTMSDGHRAAMMRMALQSYDLCMMGDTKGSGDIREMIMQQISRTLGGR